MDKITGLDAKTALKQNIIELRKKASLSQSELADKIGLSQKAMSEIETGKRWPQHDTLSKLAAVLGVEETDLLADPNMVAALKYHAGRK